MDSMFKFAQGETKFYDPADPMFYCVGEERHQFDTRKAKGAPIGIIAWLVGLAVIVTGVLNA